MSEFQAIFEYHQETGVSIQLLCSVVDVSRSGYYKWLNHTPSERALEIQQLKKRIKERFYHYKGLFGYRRITIALNRDSMGLLLPIKLEHLITTADGKLFRSLQM